MSFNRTRFTSPCLRRLHGVRARVHGFLNFRRTKARYEMDSLDAPSRIQVEFRGIL